MNSAIFVLLCAVASPLVAVQGEKASLSNLKNGNTCWLSSVLVFVKSMGCVKT